MEEKKITRPTKAQMRVLEESIAGLKDVIDSKDELIRKLESELKELKDHDAKLALHAAQSDARLVKLSAVEEELARFRELSASLEEHVSIAEDEIVYLRGRSWWRRLFNL